MKRISPLLILIGIVMAIGFPVHGASGVKLFNKHCASCHGKDGKARTKAARKLGVRDLTISKAADEQIADSIWEGRKDKNGRIKMPTFKEKLSPEEIVVLVEFVKKFRK
jgi:mono/diheme cytochrome c family protein